ncbi:MAG: transcription-repair coupling factor, partial [Clostridiales bacterium]|nr:transcription-repair coupling factor [Clostridiales bacterium]
MSCFAKVLQLNQEFQSLSQAVSQGEQPVGASGVSHIHKVQLIHALAEAEKRRSLVLAPDEASAVKFYEDLSVLREDVLLLPARDFIFYQTKGVSREYEHLRLGTLARVMAGDYAVLVCSVESALQLTMPPQELYRRTRSVHPGEELGLEGLTDALLLAGYTRCDQVEGPSQFAVRGGICDFYPPDRTAPVRAEFWGDAVDTVSAFDPVTQRRTETLEEIRITPCMEVLFDSGEALARRLENYAASLKGKAVKARESVYQDAALARQGGHIASLDRYLPIAYDTAASVFDYCGDCLLFVSETKKVRERVRAANDLMQEEIRGLYEKGVLAPGLDRFLLDFEDIRRQYETFHAVYLDTFARGSFDTPVGHLAGFLLQQLPLWRGLFSQLKVDLLPMMERGYTAVVMAGTARAGQALERDLNEAGFSAHYYESMPKQFQLGTVHVLPGRFTAGYQMQEPKFVLFSHSRGKQKERKSQYKTQKAGERIHSLEELHKGDYIVHNVHGIGIFDGIEALELSGVTKDYIKITYQKGDALYVPVTQLDLVSKYIGTGEDAKVKINRLGGQEWKRTRSRVRAAVKDMARELTRLYAQRMSTKGHAFLEDTDLQRDFELRFEYEETEDQLRCGEEIKADRERTAPMDRLLCGEVGFGKTEVALRAAFKCVTEGLQCAILVPTTLLAMQHFQTITNRMEVFPVRVEMLSRYRTPAQQKEILSALRRGEVDILVGTHRIISKDIRFKRLGLLIVDEEQRFGVSQKEKLKEKFPAVDVLTLSATPIPRTLNMAMSGIRDMSLLEEAPMDRHPVQTYVIEHDMGILAEAMEKELARGGQCYYLHNNIDSIESVAMRIQKALPDAVIAVAHGQMSQEDLNRVWERLLEGEVDILVSTTIIETGVDVANVNTLIIENADRMGLAQLHQIRGRVGRSSRRASAYFTFRRGKALSEIATQRLEAIREYTEFGSGFKIAMRDLEIRGAGNILGAQQHGHMEAVGYDMYLKLLEEAVREEKGEAADELPDQECLIDLPVDAHI